MRNRAEAIVLGVSTIILAIGFVGLSVAHSQQSSLRSELLGDGIVAEVQGRSFLEQNVRRLSPNNPVGTGRIYSDDQVLFIFELDDGTEVTGIQPISEDRYDDLGAIGDLTAVYLSGDHENAELMQDGQFVANGVPYLPFAFVVGLLALLSAGVAYRSSRPVAAEPTTTPPARPSGA